MKTLEVEARVTGTFLDSWDARCGHLAWQGTHGLGNGRMYHWPSTTPLLLD